MRLSTAALLSTLVVWSVPQASLPGGQTRPDATEEKGQRLEDLTWPDAERLLTPDTVVVLPVGAASQEHGPHLKLRSELTLATYLAGRVLESTAVVVAPALTYHHYPAFAEYPGSTSLSVDTARGATADAIRSLAAYGPRRFYVLNTSASTVQAIEPAAKALAAEGVLVRYSNPVARRDAAARGLTEQSGGGHADEIATSMMLFIDPSNVDMTKAVKDYTPARSLSQLTRRRDGKGIYSPTGIWGDPTLATRDKGRVFVEGLVAGILDDINQLRAAPLPTRTAPVPTETAAVRPTSGRAPAPSDSPEFLRCPDGDDRTIRSIGDAFAAHWANKDPIEIGKLWTELGDIVHTDGAIERGPIIITQNRAALFGRREYRDSRHPLTVTRIRCLSPDIAIADGRWELRGVLDTAGKPVPAMEGQVSLVVRRVGDWKIEAYRYTVKAPPNQLPQTAKRPGIPSGIE